MNLQNTPQYIKKRVRKRETKQKKKLKTERRKKETYIKEKE